MKFAQGRTRNNPKPPQVSVPGMASAALQHSRLLQQQTEQTVAIQHSPQQLLQRQQLQSLVSQQISLDEEEPMQGKFDVAQQAALDEEEPLQGKFALMQQAALEEEEPLQGKFEPASVSQRQADAGSNNTGMPDQLKSGIESLSGYAMDDVKVHYNSAKPAAMQAHAYAQGSDIHLAPGQEKHLPHEAWHVVQQKQGRVTATTQLKGEAINDDPGLEHEADVMGAKALQLKAKSGEACPIVQLKKIVNLNDSARNHYSDGWGKLYGIQNDEALISKVKALASTDAGTHYIELGYFDHEEEGTYNRRCYIVYRTVNGKYGDDMIYVIHCGPGNI